MCKRSCSFCFAEVKTNEVIDMPRVAQRVELLSYVVPIAGVGLV